MADEMKIGETRAHDGKVYRCVDAMGDTSCKPCIFNNSMKGCGKFCGHCHEDVREDNNHIHFILVPDTEQVIHIVKQLTPEERSTVFLEFKAEIEQEIANVWNKQ